MAVKGKQVRLSEIKIPLIEYFPAIITGFLLTMAFPKINLSAVAWAALVPLMISINQMNIKQAFYAGLTAGMTFFLSLIYWIVPTLDIYGKLPFYFSVPVLLILAFYLGLYTGIFALGVKLLNKNSIIMPLQAALLWVGLEYLRSFLFTGFPWGVLGYSQYMNINIIQIADITGVYGISFLIVMANGILSMAWATFTAPIKSEASTKSQPDIKQHPYITSEIKKTMSAILYFFIIMTIAFYYGFTRRNAISRMDKKSDMVKVSVIQGNINQSVKWNQKFKQFSAEKYCRLSEKAASDKPALIVWPETALPFYYPMDREGSDIVNKCIQKSQTDFLIGSPAFKRDKGKLKFFNRAYMINKNAVITGEYDKVHLVPFGEYVPLGNLLNFLGKLTEGAGNFSAGTRKFIPLKFKNKKAGILICFEIIFPELVRHFVNNGADILVTITNDAWFGHTSAPFQHFSMTVFRAIENRRSVARAANTGISGFIAPTGEILMTSGLFQDKFLTEKLPCPEIKTFYTCHGDLFAIICLIAIPIIFMVNIKKTNQIIKNMN